MKKLSFLFMLFIMTACNLEKPNETATTSSTDEPKAASTLDWSATGFDVDLSENVELDFEKMRIYPIVASAEHIAKHTELADLKNLKEAMDIKGFRIMEKKPYGRQNDMGAVNNLTVQNKSTETIYLMAGDVVKGGNQDRVLAQDMILPPRTLRDIEVFCVEKGRWQYRGETSEELNEIEKKSKKVFAFTGYYNVVSNDIRKTVKHNKSQTDVWNAVGKLTTTNNATTSTGTYTGLESSQDYTNERDRYLNYFTDKFDRTDNVIGMVVVNGKKVLGADVFNHPELFKKQYKVLLHSYVTDAITNGNDADQLSERRMKTYVKKLKRHYSKDLGAQEADVKFVHGGKVVHFSNL